MYGSLGPRATLYMHPLYNIVKPYYWKDVLNCCVCMVDYEFWTAYDWYIGIQTMGPCVQGIHCTWNPCLALSGRNTETLYKSSLPLISYIVAYLWWIMILWRLRVCTIGTPMNGSLGLRGALYMDPLSNFIELCYSKDDQNPRYLLFPKVLDHCGGLCFYGILWCLLVVHLSVGPLVERLLCTWAPRLALSIRITGTWPKFLLLYSFVNCSALLKY